MSNGFGEILSVLAFLVLFIPVAYLLVGVILAAFCGIQLPFMGGFHITKISLP